MMWSERAAKPEGPISVDRRDANDPYFQSIATIRDGLDAQDKAIQAVADTAFPEANKPQAIDAMRQLNRLHAKLTHQREPQNVATQLTYAQREDGAFVLSCEQDMSLLQPMMKCLYAAASGVCHHAAEHQPTPQGSQLHAITFAGGVQDCFKVIDKALSRALTPAVGRS